MAATKRNTGARPIERADTAGPALSIPFIPRLGMTAG
jgi:hypothetical protein